jgi:anti-sigma regulatory factor (Ser/Thr protein kinase)
MRSVVRHVNETYPATPDSVAQARSRVADFAGAAGAPPLVVDAVRLATSEAMTNAVVHAYSDEPGSIYVTAAVAAGELWILISDDGRGPEPRAHRHGLGLGLGLISQLSDEFAIVSRASGGTEVRMRFHVTGDATGSHSRAPFGERRSDADEMQRPGFSPSMSLA